MNRNDFQQIMNQLNAIRQYIGARYVPKFIDDPWNDTIEYEPLSVVNVSGTSYISGVPVPVGTPITDRDYWHLYGASSGAIVNLQNQIDDMKDGDIPGSLQEQININTSDITDLTKKANYVTPEDFGAVGDGVADDTTALQNALDAALPLKGVGTYKITSTLRATVEKDILLDGVILCDGSFDAVIVGSDTVPPQGYFIGKHVRIGEIRNTSEDWTPSTIGITFINVWRAEISAFIANFHTGIKLLGNNYGCAWNVLNNIITHTCKIGLVMDTANGGWCNQNTVIGGSISWVNSYAQAHASAANPCKGIIVNGNENAFYNTAVDGGGSSAAEYAVYKGVECSGAHNRFSYVRFERVGEVAFTGLYNVVDYPYLYEHITTITRTYPTSAFITLFNNRELTTDSTDRVLGLRAVNSVADFIDCFNTSNNSVFKVSANGTLTAFAALLSFAGRIKITLINDPDTVADDMPDQSVYIGYNNLNTNPEYGIMIGTRYDANRGAQFSFGIFGNIKKRVMTSGSWGAWTSV